MPSGSLLWKDVEELLWEVGFLGQNLEKLSKWVFSKIEKFWVSQEKNFFKLCHARFLLVRCVDTMITHSPLTNSHPHLFHLPE